MCATLSGHLCGGLSPKLSLVLSILNGQALLAKVKELSSASVHDDARDASLAAGQDGTNAGACDGKPRPARQPAAR